MPRITQNIPTSLGQFHPNTTTSCTLIPLIVRNTAEMALQDNQEANSGPCRTPFLEVWASRKFSSITPRPFIKSPGGSHITNFRKFPYPPLLWVRHTVNNSYKNILVSSFFILETLLLLKLFHLKECLEKVTLLHVFGFLQTLICYI